MAKRKSLNPMSVLSALIISFGSSIDANADISLAPVHSSVTNAVPLKAKPFGLAEVRLLDGPFKRAMDRDRNYLLQLDTDRLLHAFRLNAGLPSSAQPLGGWEEPKCEVRGHFLGHYLSACALMYASTGDNRLKERAILIADELAKCQEKLGSSGYLSAFPESFIDRVETTGKVWAPYYTLHKIHEGLLDVHQLCSNAKALETARKFGNWIKARNNRLSEEQLQKMLGVEHGGINESMANLYALTGDSQHLQTAQKLYHKQVLDPLAAGEDHLSGLHANTQFPKVMGIARLYELTGVMQYRQLAEFFWDRVVNHHSYAIGGNSDHEHFGQPDKLSDRISPWSTENCNTYNMLKLTRHIFAWNPQASHTDYYERALYNQILASQDPRTGMMAYHVPIYGGWFMPYNTPNDSFWCCTGTGVENHAKYGDSIYWHDSENLWINLFIPSELSWREKGITLRQETRFPQEDTVRLAINCQQPSNKILQIRYPAWAQQGGFIRVNGETISHQAKPGSYIPLQRTWKNGDQIEFRFPMSLRIESMPDNPNRVALFFGPVILAGMLGTDGIAPPMPYAKSQGDYFNKKMPPQPVLVTNKRPVSEWFKPVAGKPLTFRTEGVGKPEDVTFAAFYSLIPQRYSLYWDLMTRDQWKNNQEATALQKRLAKELSDKTVDSVVIGDHASERAHKLQGENSASGPFQDLSWRHASDGGWFSYQMKVESNTPQSLLVKYWGSDAGLREFDIVVDGVRLATQKLQRNEPDQFFEVMYAIPQNLIQGKTQVTIKFQAHANCTAGGIFDCRIVRNQ